VNDEAKSQASSQVDMKDLERDFKDNVDRVCELLVHNVLSVNIEIPKVVKGVYE